MGVAGPLMLVASFELQLVSLLPVWCTMSDLVGQPVPWGHLIPVMAINFVPLSVLGAPIILFSVQGSAGCGFGACWTLV